jgi:hypothetical protein
MLTAVAGRLLGVGRSGGGKRRLRCPQFTVPWQAVLRPTSNPIFSVLTCRPGLGALRMFMDPGREQTETGRRG